ncbi:FMN-dependent dehydrogenase-domain-containing protein [Spinellus fusiger]|nr:FMN-dependent dehydrogenase-domain-containing protein [Spinellus fusiger]
MLLTLQQVARHNKKEDIWVILHGKVYDLTEFLPEHPGGQKIILKYAGKDATQAFDPIHPKDIIERLLPASVYQGDMDPEELKQQQEAEEESPKDKAIRLARKAMPHLDEIYNTFDFENIARKVMSPEGWGYYSSGAGDEITMRENHSAYHRIWLRPRILVNVKSIDTTTTMLGTKVSFPLYISATALGKLGHPEGEKVLTRAAGRANVIYMVPTLASCSFDELVDSRLDHQTQWLQLYVNENRALSKKLIQHAEARGIKGLFITVDAPQLAYREKDMRQKYTQDVPSEMKGTSQQMERDEGAARAISSYIDPSLAWEDIPWFKSITQMPIIIKGVQCVEDALMAARYGCQGVVLSNHGGRQLDFAPSSIEVLADVMEALNAQSISNFEVYVDGGIRRGTDIFKAIALGATGVGIGRPALYAMSTYGDQGVDKLLYLLKRELVECMRLMGAPTIKSIHPTMVDTRNLKDHFMPGPTDHLSSFAYEKMQPVGNSSKL